MQSAVFEESFGDTVNDERPLGPNYASISMISEKERNDLHCEVRGGVFQFDGLPRLWVSQA